MSSADTAAERAFVATRLAQMDQRLQQARADMDGELDLYRDDWSTRHAELQRAHAERTRELEQETRTWLTSIWSDGDEGTPDVGQDQGEASAAGFSPASSPGPGPGQPANPDAELADPHQGHADERLACGTAAVPQPAQPGPIRLIEENTMTDFEHETEVPASAYGAARRAAWLAHHAANSAMADRAAVAAHGRAKTTASSSRASRACTRTCHRMTEVQRRAAMQAVAGSDYGGRPLERHGHLAESIGPAPARVDMTRVNDRPGYQGREPGVSPC